MKKINTLLAVLFVLVSSITMAGINPAFIVEEESENVVVYLQFEDAPSYIAVSIEGQYQVNGVTQTKTVEIAGQDLENLNSELVKIQSIDKEYDFVSYTIEVVDQMGDVWQYPQVDM